MGISGTLQIPAYNGCYAIFVDAGYLFAAGSAALTGEKKHRKDILLDIEVCKAHLKSMSVIPQNCQLLRIYWYDAVGKNGLLTSEQTIIARSDNIKIRLGFINAEGKQKGVDSLIVTDLIELARNRVINDAILLSGDGDLNIGMTIAQSFGVRLHLLGIKTQSDSSQSSLLMNEADTHRFMAQEQLSQFMQIISKNTTLEINLWHKHINSIITRFSNVELGDLEKHRSENKGLFPLDIDAELLKSVSQELGRALSEAEKPALRKAFKTALKQAINPKI